jgi:ribosomal 50S subunit-associated protein YjgA (DUF615 family)
MIAVAYIHGVENFLTREITEISDLSKFIDELGPERLNKVVIFDLNQKCVNINEIKDSITKKKTFEY